MSSALPKHVQAQVDKANEILKKQNEPPAAPPVPAAAAPAPAAPAPAAPAAPAAPVDESWQHKYNVLQGKYNAEVPRLQKQVNESNDLLRDVRQRLTNAETLIAAQRSAPAPAAPSVPAVDADDLTPDEVATYGEDLVNVIRRLGRVESRKVVPQIVKPVSDRVEKVAQTTSQVSETVAVSKQQETIRQLAEAVPGWAAQNQDPGFFAWLDKVDELSGQPRGVLLRQAFQANDATRVIRFFEGYLKENAAVQPGSAPSTPPAPAASPPAEPQTRMEDLVAPGAPKAPTASAPEGAKRVWTRTEVTAFYAKKNEFIRKGKPIPEELVKLERDLFAAQNEGRLRPG